MPRLRNPRHEAFAQAYAKGLTLKEAYVVAGYSSTSGYPSRLVRRPDVAARVRELLDRRDALDAFNEASALCGHLNNVGKIKDNCSAGAAREARLSLMAAMELKREAEAREAAEHEALRALAQQRLSENAPAEVSDEEEEEAEEAAHFITAASGLCTCGAQDEDPEVRKRPEPSARLVGFRLDYMSYPKENPHNDGKRIDPRTHVPAMLDSIDPSGAPAATDWYRANPPDRIDASDEEHAAYREAQKRMKHPDPLMRDDPHGYDRLLAATQVR